MTLVHYSAEPFAFDPERTYPYRDHFKPVGLWLSVEGNDDGWAEWCRGEEFNIDGLTHCTVFELTPDANVLRLSTPDDVRRMTRLYGVALYSGGRREYVDWSRVRKQYDGVVISPYQWECRHDRDTHWYYSWDCASACVWNLRAIRLAGMPT